MAMAVHDDNHWKLSFSGSKPAFAAMAATSIGTKTLKPVLAARPIPIATAVISSALIFLKNYDLIHGYLVNDYLHGRAEFSLRAFMRATSKL
jgi:hypothetical protein